MAGSCPFSDDTRTLELEAAWHIEWTFRRPPPVGSGAWHEVADEYFRRSAEMMAELEAMNERMR